MATSNKCQGTVHTTQCATVPPSPQLQALIDKANDKRSFWTKAGDFFSGAWEGTKRVAEASWNDPGNTGIGVAKGVGNLPSDVWNLLVLGSKYAGPIPQAMQADALNYAALQTYQRGDTATANALAGRASEMMQAGYASDIFEIKGDAQKGGSVLSMLVPVGAIAKGAGTAAKVVRGTKALDTAADAAKAGKAVDAGADAARVGDVGADAARAGEGGGAPASKPVGDGIAIDAKKAPKRKLQPGTAEHKADRWQKYQERGGKKDYEQWSKQYDTNMRNYQFGAAREGEYRVAMDATEGTVKTPLTNRQIDILKADEMYAGQLKTGPVSLTQENILAIQKDAELVKSGWQVEHILEQGASKPYLDALKAAGIDSHIGSKIPK